MVAINFSEEEVEVLKRWREIDAFRVQLELTKDKPPYAFYDGPPFATGLPHYGHMLTSTIKDVIPRYWAMKGYFVECRFGWDTHGVPIDYEIDKSLGIKGKQAILEYGIANYNRECEAIVMRYAAEWRTMIERLGRWVDFDNDYKTMDKNFMETCWWVFKQLHEKGAVYRGFKVMPYSTALTTPLSNNEAQENYKMVQDPAIVVTFPLVDDPKTCLLAWTTTPWTLPAHTSIAANPDFEYVKIYDEKADMNYILLESLIGTLYKKPEKEKYTIVARYKGSDMLGWKYEPPFRYFYDQFKDYGFRVNNDSYVTATSGVGLVHQAPAFGEEDFAVATRTGIITIERPPNNPVDDKGCFTSEVTDFAGQYVKDADKRIVKHLQEQGRLVVSPIIPQMLEQIEQTYWVPSVVREKRFANWIANARDWAVSRNRYWGTPLPLWVSDEDEEVVCRLQRHTTDLHRHNIDHITIPSKQGKGILRRVEEVFDCWFESGSMPYSSQHYPFENKEEFERRFPADFIGEGLDQTRGWFYTLLVLGIYLFGVYPFKKCVVNGMVLAEDGKKMSKRLKNYPDPSIVIQRYGCDAIRLYLINSPVVRGEHLNFKESGVKEVVQKVLLPLWNSYRFFEDQVLLLRKKEGIDFKFSQDKAASSESVLDHWIMATCQSFLKTINEEMAVPRLLELIDSTTNWYIRLNRQRLKGDRGTDEAVITLNTFFAPFMPFLADKLWLHLQEYMPRELLIGDVRSVHFLPFPEPRSELSDEVVERRFARMQKVIELGRVCREKEPAVSLKQALKTLTVLHPDQEYLDDVASLADYIKDELSIVSLVLSSDESRYGVQYRCAANWATFGKKFRKDAKKVAEGLAGLSSTQVKQLMHDNAVKIAGFEVLADDVVIKREIASDVEGSGGTEIGAHGDVLILLDKTIYPELIGLRLTREIASRVQKLRKKAALVPTDEVLIEYTVLSDPDDVGIEDALATQTGIMERMARLRMEKHKSTSERAEDTAGTKAGDVIIEEVQEVQGALFSLRLSMA
ncbi:isoleucyl-tRNA synthetase,cytoplasmic [Ilyonectria robusta]|uniref:isoleucyl-tRNA synthetase,cytoplasmic n=1 Tax=Ilyonectria robusta TaxID=1079257 RepID=UPI001E8D0C06|nr:isoleucyl-tRNA synthetase,cytoplasmic [Ilyonectria robusta]KAH8729182.1 isoleucyl-tRNA synthetase,cytoplasmic [Ilyonectria robusta]